MLINEIIRKVGDQYRLYSKKGKNLGTYDSRAGAEKREKQINYFKHMSEGYKLQLERDSNMYVLHILDTETNKRTEVRGKPDYETTGYDANDKLHQLLDKIGKSANISELINGEVVTINPKHPDATKAKAATDVAFNESTDLDSLRKFVRSQREAPDQVLYQMMMAPDTYGHEASDFVRSWYENTKEENGLNDVDSALEIMVDELGLGNVNEAKDYMHGYCHEWALNDIKENPGRVLYARTGFHYDDEYEEVDHVFTVDPKTGKAYDVRGEFANADALLADHDFGADEIDVMQIYAGDIRDWISAGELKPISIGENFKVGNVNEETGAEMLKIFRNMHHDTARNKEMDAFIKSHEWELRDFTPDMFPSEEEFFDYDDPFNRIIDIDYSHRVDLSQPIIVGPQYSDGKYSVIDGNHRAAQAQQMGKTIKGYFPVKPTSEGVAHEPHAAGLAKTALTAPANTVIINTPGELDWYKLGEYIATLQDLDPHEYGQSESDMMVTLANRKQVEKLKALLDRFGADYKEIGGTHQHPEVHVEGKKNV